MRLYGNSFLRVKSFAPEQEMPFRWVKTSRISFLPFNFSCRGNGKEVSFPKEALPQDTSFAKDVLFSKESPVSTNFNPLAA